jgi:hypothetical protein
LGVEGGDAGRNPSSGTSLLIFLVWHPTDNRLSG